MVITFHLLQIATWYLACVFISWRRSLWWVTCQGQGHPSRSKVKLKVTTWYLAYICVTSTRTFWGVKCQGQGHPSRSKVNLKVTTWFSAYMCVTSPCRFWWVKCQGQGHHSRSKVKLKVKTAIAHSNLIFGKHMCHITPHILRGAMSRSSFKVKGQIEGQNSYCT